MPRLARAASRSSSRIWAWIVTSSAVVGSSAISRLGRARQRHRDHHALAHAAGELVRVGARAVARRAGCRRAPSARPRGRAPRALLMSRSCARICSTICLPTRWTGFSERHRVLEDHRDLRAADPAQLVVGRADQLGAVEARRALEARVGRARQPHQRHRGHRLARAGLADDRHDLARLDGERTPSTACTTPVLGAEGDAQVLDREQRLRAALTPQPDPRVEQA